jgi:hypothetical protein
VDSVQDVRYLQAFLARYNAVGYVGRILRSASMLSDYQHIPREWVVPRLPL